MPNKFKPIPALSEARIAVFWSRVQVGAADACWLWCGKVTARGYGSYSNFAAHRIAYTIACGPIPDGLELDHLCRTPLCVNPHHLEPVSGAENIRRGYSPTAINARKTHCPKGHPYTPETLRNDKRGYRGCEICRREWNAAYLRKRRAATPRTDEDRRYDRERARTLRARKRAS